MYQPNPGDRVVIEDVQSGSRDVVGLTGTLLGAAIGGGEPDVFTVSTPFSPSLSVDVLATKVRPA